MDIYFNFLPDDVNINILTGISRQDTHNLKWVSDGINNLLKGTNTYKRMLVIFNRHFFDFIMKVKNNISDWEEMYYAYKYVKECGIPYVLNSDGDNSIYFYKISLEFPKFFERIKDVNLLHTYYREGYTLTWFDIYSNIKKYFKNFSDTITYQEYVYYTLNMEPGINMSEICMSENFTTFVRFVLLEGDKKTWITEWNLFRLFIFNHDIYDYIIKGLNNKEINDLLDNFTENSYKGSFAIGFVEGRRVPVNSIKHYMEDLRYRIQNIL